MQLLYRGGQTVGVASARDQQAETPIVIDDQHLVAVEGPDSGVAALISGMPSSSVAGRASSSAAERGKDVVIDDYESESDLDPDDVRTFKDGLTHSVVNAGGSACTL